ncbi:MAG: hypothetical protein Q4C68_04595 [Moraxella sp.]|nr:hypothetical protein [Moraxella sp.]
MNYNTVKDMATQLNFDDKLRLASLLIQMALTESNRQDKVSSDSPESADYQYCLERILKSKPNRLSALKNYLEAILGFRGSSAADIDDIIKRLQLKQVIKVDGDTVTYL